MADEATAVDTTAKSQIEVGYTVQNPHITPSATRAVVGGKEMVATVDAFEVELVADSLSNGGIKLRFIGDEIPAAQALFINDAKIKAQFVGG
jgi:hypothetical protein